MVQSKRRSEGQDTMKQAMKTWEGCFEHANKCLQVCRSTQLMLNDSNVTGSSGVSPWVGSFVGKLLGTNGTFRLYKFNLNIFYDVNDEIIMRVELYMRTVCLPGWPPAQHWAILISWEGNNK